MNIRELILTRRTVHAFTPEKVSDRLVEEALTLSLWAPNHKLTYPWVYTWLGSEARAALGELSAERKGGRATPKGKAAYDSVVTPSHVISLGVKRASAKPEQEQEQEQEHEDYATLACSVQIMSLYLWLHGICTKWTTSGWSTDSRAYDVIGVNPTEVMLEGCLLIGREQMMPEAPRRPALADVLRRTK